MQAKNRNFAGKSTWGFLFRIKELFETSRSKNGTHIEKLIKKSYLFLT